MLTESAGKVKRLGVLTGGGDVPGLNAAIKAIVYRAHSLDISVMGLRAGWEGITFLDRSRSIEDQTYRVDDDRTWVGGYVMPLNRLNTRTIERDGGTMLQSTRTNPANVRAGDLPSHLARFGKGKAPDDRADLTDEVLANLSYLGLDGLIVIGGDDTLSYGAKLVARGFPAWGIPKTMDNDVPGTDYCIGFQTAIGRAAEFIGRVRSTAGSHRETVIFRMFGRDAGFTALETAIVTWADRVLIPEVPCQVDKLAELVAQDRHNPSGYSIVVLSEGANLEGTQVPELGPPDAYGHRVKSNVGEFLAEQLAVRLPHIRFLPVDLTYILRSGEPDPYDKHMAIFYANLIMNAVGGQWSVVGGQNALSDHRPLTGVMAAYRKGDFIYTDIPGKDLSARRVDPADYNAARYRPNFEGISGRYAPRDA